MALDLESPYTSAGFVILNVKTQKYVGCDSASGGYPWESDSIQGMIWRTREEAEKFCGVSGFKAFGSEEWSIKTVYVR